MAVERKSILLVDSDERSRQLVELSLKKEGYGITAVSGTIDALVALSSDSFALIIASKDLSDGDGFELLAQCQVDPNLGSTPFLLISDDATGDSSAALEGGAVGVLGKPVRVKTVVATVAAAIGEPDGDDHDATPEFPEDAVFTVEYRSFVASIGDLPEDANAVIRMFDGKRTLKEAIADCEVADDVCRAMIPQLLELGVLSPDDASAAAVDTFVTARVTANATVVGEADEASRLEAVAREAEETARRAAETARRAAEEARRRAEEARRKAEEERRRRDEEERQRALAELEELDAKQREIEEAKAAELEAARNEADRVMREAEARAAALESEARRKASELDDREKSLVVKRENLTARLAAIGAGAPPAPVRTEAELDKAVGREREAMEQEASSQTLAFSPGDVASRLNTESEETEIAPTGRISAATPAAAVAAAATASAAGAADTIPPTDPSDPEFADSFFKDSSFYATRDIEDGDDELFAEPSRAGIPPIWMAMGMLLVLGIIVVLIQGGGDDSEPGEPVPETETDPIAEADEGSADEGSAEPVIDEGPTEEELAAAALEEATRAATDSGLNQADDIEFVAREVAAILAEAVETDQAAAPVANTAPSRPRTEEAPRRTDPDPPAAPTDAEQALEQCANFSSNGDYSATIDSCQAAVRANPRSSDAYTYLGKAHYELGDIDSAINFLQQAVRLNGRNRTALLALGAARQDAGDNDGAREAYERYLEINPDSRYAAEVRSILETL